MSAYKKLGNVSPLKYPNMDIPEKEMDFQYKILTFTLYCSSDFWFLCSFYDIKTHTSRAPASFSCFQQCYVSVPLSHSSKTEDVSNRIDSCLMACILPSKCVVYSKNSVN